MPWWGWLVIGALLFGAEMFVIDAQFFLVFFGIAAALVGLAGAMGLEWSPAAQWLLFALLSVVAMLGFRERVYKKLRRPPVADVQEPWTLGDRVLLTTPLDPGASCRVEYRGSTWNARNIDHTPLQGEAEIAAVDNLTLHLRRIGSQS